MQRASPQVGMPPGCSFPNADGWFVVPAFAGFSYRAAAVRPRYAAS
jgi:hypothetical protein